MIRYEYNQPLKSIGAYKIAREKYQVSYAMVEAANQQQIKLCE